MMTKKEILQFYEQVRLIRECEERVRREYPHDQIKTPTHLSVGAEAIAVGVIRALPKGSKLFGTYRNHGIYLAASLNTDSFFGELYGKATGCAQGVAGSMHLTSPEDGLFLTSAVVGTTIAPAVGAAFANQYRGHRDVAASFFGDGAMEEGVFWESLNFAALHQLRILFVCEDNDLAIHASGNERRGFRSMREAVKGFRCQYDEADGTRVDRVYQTTEKAINRMRRKAGPWFLRFPYYRYLEHVGIHEDFKAGYRKKPSAKFLKEKDPVLNAEKFAVQKGITQSEIKRINEKVEQQIDISVEKAKLAPYPEPEVLTRHVIS